MTDLGSLTDEQACAEVENLLAQWEAAKAERTALDRRCEGIRGMIAAFAVMYPAVESLVGSHSSWLLQSENRPRGAESIRLVLMENPGVGLTVGELLRSLQQRGWLPESDSPANAVRTACERLVANGEPFGKRRDRDGAVVYLYRPPEP